MSTHMQRARLRVRIEQAIALGRSRAYILATMPVTEAEYDAAWRRMEQAVYCADEARGIA